MMSKVPYEHTDYTGSKLGLFINRPSIYWSLKSTFRPFVVVNSAEKSREALSICATKSDDMFLVHRQKKGPAKFGQLIIPVLPESILTNTKSNLRGQLRNHLNKVNREHSFFYILELYETHKKNGEGVHLFIVMVCIYVWIELDDPTLLNVSRSFVKSFNYFFSEIISCPQNWLTTACTKNQEDALMTLVSMISKTKDMFRVNMTVDSMVNVINAAHDAIYSAFLHLLKFDQNNVETIRETLKDHPNILAAGRHTTQVVQLFKYRIPANVDVVISLKGVSAFSYGEKSCVAKSRFAIELLQFMMDNQIRFEGQTKNIDMFKKLLLFIE